MQTTKNPAERVALPSPLHSAGPGPWLLVSLAVFSALSGITAIIGWFVEGSRLGILVAAMFFLGGLGCWCFVAVVSYRKKRQHLAEHERVGDAMRALATELQRTLDTAATGLTRCGRDLHYRSANVAYSQIIGKPIEQIIGRPICEVIGQSAFEVVAPYIERVLTGERVQYEAEIPYAGGSRFTHVIYSPDRDSKGAVIGWVASVTDMTERKHTEAALRASEERYRMLFNKNPDAVFSLDTTGRFILVNPAAEKISGYSSAELHSKTFMGLCVPEMLARTVEQFTHCVRERAYTELETAIIHKEGHRVEIWAAGEVVVENGSVISVHCTARDITERNRAQLAVKQSEERLQTAKRAAQLGIHDWDVTTGKVCWDERVRQLWGISQGMPVNYDVFIAGLHPDDRDATQTAVNSALNPEGDGEYYAEYRVINRNDGQTRWVAATGHVTFEEGRAVRLVGTVQDITEQKTAQELLARSKEELERVVAERTAKLQELVEELEHFSYTITHDMRAPLRSMRGYAECLQELWESPEYGEQNALLQRIIASAERMDLLIMDALSYNKAVRQEFPLSVVDVGKLIQGMLDSYPEFQAWKGRVELQANIPPVLGNQAGLTQCFSNLIGNAIKFVAPGTQPEIRVRSERVSYSTSLPFRNGSSPVNQSKEAGHAEWVRIWVEDNGIGIAPSLMPRIFNMFTRGNNSYEGTGIGLALVRKVVARMGGRVGVESEPGKGSRFWIELPASKPQLPRNLYLPSLPEEKLRLS